MLTRSVTFIVPLDPKVVLRILSDPSHHAYLLTFLENIEIISNNEFTGVTKFRIGKYRLNFRISVRDIKEKSGSVIINGSNGILITIEADVEPFVNGSLVRYTLSIKAGRFKEALMSAELTSIANSIKTKMQFELPSIAQTVLMPTPPTTRPEKPVPQLPKETFVKTEIKAHTEPTSTVTRPEKPKAMETLSETFEQASKRLSDVVVKSYLVMKGKYHTTKNLVLPTENLVPELIKLVANVKSDLKYILGVVKENQQKFRAVIKDNELLAFSLENVTKEITGSEALNEVSKLKGNVKCRIFEIPSELQNLFTE